MKRLLRSIDDIIAAAWQRVKSNTFVTPEDSSLFRIFFGLYFLLSHTPRYGWLNDIPDALYYPPIVSMGIFFDGFPPGIFVQIANIAQPILLFCVTVGIKARLTGIASALLNFVVTTFIFSFGKIDHSFTPWLALLVLSFSNWGTRYAVLPDKQSTSSTHSNCFAFLATFMVFAMFTAGLEKAKFWVDFDLSTNGFLSWFYLGYFSLGRDEMLAPLVLKIDPRFFEIADYTAVVFELTGFLFLIFSQRSWRLWLILACAFHLANTLLLNISFHFQILGYGVFIFRFSSFHQKIAAFIESKRAAIPTFVSLVAASAAIHVYQRIDSPGTSLLFGLLSKGEGPSPRLIIASIVWLLAIVMAVASLRLKDEKHPEKA